MSFVLRPATAADDDFLARLYASSRADELSAVPFTDEQRRAFLAHQFAAQSAHFAKHYGDASYDVVEIDGVAAGRLIVWRSPGEIVVVDIALLPEQRGAGVGTALMQAVLDEADGAVAKVTVHVESFNPAQRLYTRLGFKPVGGDGVYIEMARPSGEDGFVADAVGVAADRDEEDVDPPEPMVLERDGLLRDDGLGGTAEGQRERPAVTSSVPVGGGRLQQLEVQVERVGAQRESISDVGREVVHREPVGHRADANRGFTRRRALQIGALAGLSTVWMGPSLARAATSSTPAYLRRSSYTGLVGKSFAIDGGSYQLTSVADVAGAATDAALRGNDETFVLTFQGPGGLDTGIHTFSHPDLGSYSLSAGPVDELDAASQRYEVVVDRSVGRPADVPAAPDPQPVATEAEKQAAAEEVAAATPLSEIPGAPAPARVARKQARKHKHKSKHKRKLKRRVKAAPPRTHKVAHRTRKAAPHKARQRARAGRRS